MAIRVLNISVDAGLNAGSSRNRLGGPFAGEQRPFIVLQQVGAIFVDGTVSGGSQFRPGEPSAQHSNAGDFQFSGSNCIIGRVSNSDGLRWIDAMQSFQGDFTYLWMGL